MKKMYNNSILPLWIPVMILTCCFCNNRKQTGTVEEAGYYQEKYRPQYHFSPESGWMNDPNGLVYYDGEYHLFYQYFPDSTVWGPMHWGHAVSSDMLHWNHLPVALYPDSLGYVFSGSAVVDKANTSGFGNNNNPALVAVFTYHNQKLAGKGIDSFQSQGIAYSTDKGRTWTKYSGNPVLPNPGKRDFRDPKVFWYQATGKWIMILAVYDRVYIYSSPDLKSWSFESEFGDKAGAHGGVWECPDLFPVTDKGSEKTKWVMLVSINPGAPNGGSATQYFTGSFDGHLFVPDYTNERWLDWGTDNYAGVTWSGIPEADGRRLFIGWMSNWNYATVVPTKNWRSAMTIPRELSIIFENGNYYLISKPVSELTLLRKESKSILPERGSNSGNNLLVLNDKRLNQCELVFDFIFPEAGSDSICIILENTYGEKFIAGYSAREKNIFLDRTKSGNSSFSERFPAVASAPYEASDRLSIHLFIDVSSAELFVDNGKRVLTNIFFPEESYSQLKVLSKAGNVLLEKAEFHELNKIWP